MDTKEINDIISACMDISYNIGNNTALNVMDIEAYLDKLDPNIAEHIREIMIIQKANKQLKLLTL